MKQDDVEEIQRRYAAMAGEEFALLRREDLTNDGRAAYDREAKRRTGTEWVAQEASREAEYAKRLQAEKEALTGISGWLILPAISLVANLGIGIIGIAVNWSQLSATAPRVSLSDTAYLTFTLLVAVAFFRKRPFVPKLMVVWILAAVGLTIAENAGLLFQGIVATAIWVPYFLVSRRVRNTFA